MDTGSTMGSGPSVLWFLVWAGGGKAAKLCRQWAGRWFWNFSAWFYDDRKQGGKKKGTSGFIFIVLAPSGYQDQRVEGRFVGGKKSFLLGFACLGTCCLLAWKCRAPTAGKHFKRFLKSFWAIFMANCSHLGTLAFKRLNSYCPRDKWRLRRCWKR